MLDLFVQVWGCVQDAYIGVPVYYDCEPRSSEVCVGESGASI